MESLPAAVKEPLLRNLEPIREQHETEVKNGFGGVFMPYALERKYPNGAK